MWPIACSFLNDASRNARLHGNIVAVESALGKPERFECRLHIHSEIDDVRDKLSVCLRLVPAAHDAEADQRVAFL